MNEKMTVVLGALLCATMTNTVHAHEATTKAPTSATKPIGDFKVMGDGTVRSWVQLGKNGKPSSLGITFSETALNGLPKGVKGRPNLSSFEYLLQLPPQAKTTGINHISFDWEPLGHEPKGVYDVPHFDLHFYEISTQQRAQISGRGMNPQMMDKKPASQFLPAGYILPPGTGVPRMGAHWMNGASPELHGKPFLHTFVYGSYNGRVNFLEPMISKALLDRKSDVTAPIAQPKALQKPALFPTRYHIFYNATRHEYSISLENLQWRK